MNWFFGITAGVMVLIALSFVVYNRIKTQKLDRPPIFVVLQLGYAVCAVAIMNLRDRHEALAIALAVVEVILLAISGPMVWRRFVKHLRDEGLTAKKGAD
jgi:hypothetical protein